jgi:lipopolysaccharide transport system ATP-binding protein
MTTLAIRLQGIGKCYDLATGYRQGSLAERLGGMLPGRPRRVPPSEGFWALRGVDLEVRPGEVVGVIGRNGSGKSTLMKILARITPPTEGRGEIHGRVGALLEVGTGIHPDLTGRQNVFLNGSILGLRRADISARLDAIVAFAEVDRFIDQPVKFYSSGMFARLAFAITAHLDAEIMLVDEITAVGDAGFERKSLAKLREIVRTGRTVLFISHDMGAVRTLCDRCLVVDRGRVVLSDAVDPAIALYEEICYGPPVRAALDGRYGA